MSNLTFNDLMNDYKPSMRHRGGQTSNISVPLSHFVKNACSIDAYKNIGTGSRSCFTLEQLKKIASSYNKKYPNNKIIYNSSTRKDDLWNAIQQKLSNKCNDTEWCWLDQSFLKTDKDNHNLEKQFKPRGPKKLNDWLSTTDIDDAMKLYEQFFPSFRFFGPVPIDFDGLNTELLELKIARLYKEGKHYIGIIFNLDPHYKSGSHWVAMYVDIPKGGIYYYDSYAVCDLPKEIKKLKNSLIKNMTEFHKSIGSNVKVHYDCNTYRHQYKNSECGVFSMYFILEMLRGRTFKSVTSNIILDDEIRQMRQVYFRPKYN